MPASTKNTLEQEISRLSQKIWERYQRVPSTERILIGISGIPGSGKSTLAARMASSLNDMYRRDRNQHLPNFAVDIPMDGYHYSRAHLAAMPNPEEAIHRRGAAFTFDAEKFCELVGKLREPLTAESKTIYAPSFDHAVKDPVADSIAVSAKSRIIFLEGNYISLDREPWKLAAQLMDERWFVTVERDVARERLAKRHVASGIVPDTPAAYYRIDSTDGLNADDVLENLLEVDEEIPGGG